MNIIMKKTMMCRIGAAVFAVGLFVAVGADAGAQQQSDLHTVTATANYRPVDIPGTQRRVAQTDAEEIARKEIYEYIGSMRLADGRTVNDILARDARLKARVLEIIRNSKTIEWAVAPGCACVQVWVQLDIRQVRAALGACGY